MGEVSHMLGHGKVARRAPACTAFQGPLSPLRYHRPAQHVRHARDEPVCIQRLRGQRLASRKGQEATGQDGAALGRLLDAVDELLNV